MDNVESTETIIENNEQDINENDEALAQELLADSEFETAGEAETATAELASELAGMSAEDKELVKQEAASAKKPAKTKEPKPPKEKAPAAHLAFIEAVRVHALTLGLGYKDQVGFAQFFEAETGHKLYIAKQGKQVKRVDTTLPLIDDDGTVLLEGAFPLSQKNGKVACHIPAEQTVVFEALKLMSEKAFGKIRAADRPPGKAKDDVGAPTVTYSAESPAA